jgi:glutathione peroxidase
MEDKLARFDLQSLKYGLLTSAKFYNKSVVIFNSASLCGYSKQFLDFQQLYEEGNIVPIALPTNEFDCREPGDDYEIDQYCRIQYKISFPICQKTNFTHKLFETHGLPDWNFNKYLFNSRHVFIKKFDAKFDPKELLTYV